MSIASADGSNQIRLTYSPGNDYHADWSADGEKIIFVSHRTGNAQIYIMDKDGENLVRLTNNSNNDMHPVWGGPHINRPPEVGPIDTTHDPVPTGFDVIANAAFSDPDISDTHTAVWDWGDGSTSEGTVDVVNKSVSGNHTYITPGVYTINLTVTDQDGASGNAPPFQFVVVYDPNGGFVTGGGWINSPEGAYAADPTLTGKATFGFVSKYKKGAEVPTGETDFQFHVANLNFHSDSYDWLVVAGHQAKYKGVGTINGSGNYGFMISAIDEKLTPSTDVDRFRIKIWDKDNGDVVVYDNQMEADEDADPTTAIEGGNIVIHKAK